MARRRGFRDKGTLIVQTVVLSWHLFERLQQPASWFAVRGEAVEHNKRGRAIGRRWMCSNLDIVAQSCGSSAVLQEAIEGVGSVDESCARLALSLRL